MNAFVLDASVALTWCFEDEATPSSVGLLDRMQTENAAVPATWPIEVANVLALAERRRRISSADSASFLAKLQAAGIEVDRETPLRAFTQILDLARRERLTAYDAAYLELAMRLGVPLATNDTELADAAERLGVSVLSAG